MTKQPTSFNKGSSLVEVVIVAGVLSMVTFSFFASFSAISRLHERNMLSVKGGLLAEEAIEAVRLMKDNGWSNVSSLARSTDLYLELRPSFWAATTTPEVVDGVFYRRFRIEDAMRDASSRLVPSGGAQDQNAILVESSVSWNWRGSTSTVSYKAYVTNI